MVLQTVFLRRRFKLIKYCKICCNYCYNVRSQHSVTVEKSNLSIPKKDVHPDTLPKAYKPQEIEKGWYEWWEANGYFQARGNGKPFTMLLPPPNVTGTLHLGHALTGTVQDVIARWRRMKKDSVVWIPGVDHAGIATQVVVEKYLQKSVGLSKHDLGREKFVGKVWQWKDEKGNRIIEQLRGMGLSLDWNRLVFTMDQAPSEAVKEAFMTLYDRGLIYRANGLVNWSCALQSSISDVEIEMREITGPTSLNLPGCSAPVEFGVLTNIAYRLHKEDSDTEIVVATTRPETMLGDTAIALHPDDPRRPQLEGKSVWHPFRQCPIPIIFDPFVEPQFGTGAVKITPAHDSVDQQVGKRHNLQTVQVFDESGKIRITKYKGKQRYEARKLIVDQLKSLGLLRGTQSHSMQIPICSRSGDVVELMLKPQWFLDCKKAAKVAVEAVEKGDLVLEPENYKRVWKNWLENIRDWNISRQLWWGHRIPAYEGTVKGSEERTWVAARSEEEARLKVAGILKVATENVNVVADPDVLDTWFSSGLFPLYSLGWPKGGREFEERFPISLMETGNDIIFFWVARMVMMSLLLTDRLPFSKVLLHGVVCDAKGRKMSKSLGNVIAPEDVIFGASLAELEKSVRDAHDRGLLTEAEVEASLLGQKKLFPSGIPECGVDALRFTLCSQDIQSDRISFDVPTCHTNKLFCNKILQAFKFMLISMNNETDAVPLDATPEHMSSFDRWILSRLASALEEVTSSLETNQFHLATKALKQFWYFELCDVYLESIKPVLRSDDTSKRLTAISCLFHCLNTGLKLLHPFMPYLSEELYQRLPQLDGFERSESIMIADYPKNSDLSDWKNLELDEVVERVQDVVSAVRKIKALFGVKGQKPEVIVISSNESLRTFVSENEVAVKTISKSSLFSILPSCDASLIEEYFKEVVDDKTTVYANFQNAKQIRLERLEPTLKKEQKILLELEKLDKLVGGGDGKKRKLSAESIAKHLHKVRELQVQLEKIAEMKKLLQGGR